MDVKGGKEKEQMNAIPKKTSNEDALEMVAAGQERETRSEMAVKYIQSVFFFSG